MSTHLGIADSTYAAAKNMSRQVENALVEALKRAGYDDWKSIPNLSQRLLCVYDWSTRESYYYFDSKPILTLGALTTDVAKDLLTFERKIRQEIPQC